jgi:N-acyl-D-amino-acid deacylase
MVAVTRARIALIVLVVAVTVVLTIGSGPGSAAPARAPKTAPDAGPALITGATVIDGTGEPGRRASVRLAAGLIAAVGALSPEPGERVVDGTGLVLAPGFIDTHSHADGDIFEHPDALAAVSQGITTVIGGQDGGSSYPLEKYLSRLRRHPAAINVGMYGGHGTYRERVMGKDFRRPATGAELARMETMLAEDMRAGAFGLATGLEYDPGIYSAPGEVVALAKVAAAYGGRYISHIRSEDRDFWKAIDEIIDIGRQARLPVQVSHMKLAMRSLWGHSDDLLRRLDEARASGVDITADVYPYTYWHSTLTVLFPQRDFANRDTAAFVLKEVAAPDGLLMGRFDPDPKYVGMTLAQIATQRGTDPVTTLIDMIRESEAMRSRRHPDTESVIGTSMDENDVRRLVAWEHSNVCTDGELDGRHPRGFGSYPRILGRYVRDDKVLTLEGAIHRMTGLAAAHMGLADRGLVKPGMKADLVLFDPATVIDHATLEQPQALSAGIVRVWVNGTPVWSDGSATGSRPGQVILGPGAKGR